MKLGYWIATTLVCAFMAISAYRYMTDSPAMVAKFHHLGYPDHFRHMLGVAKLAGVVALLVPAVPSTLREWAYAGFAFDLIGAVAAHLFVGDPGTHTVAPLVLLALLLVSRRFRRPAGTRLVERIPSSCRARRETESL